jgi:hypothetical protein
VLGRATHAVLRWRLESGERCGTLDVLAGSTSLTSTIVSLLQLRMVTFLGLFLATIWALSPVGGQASFRQVTTGNKTYDHTTSFDYMVPDGILDVVNAGSDNIKWWGVIDNLFIAALVGPATTKASPRDLWGNVRIPHIETFEEAVSADSDGWFKVQMDQNTNTSFASLLGVPMTGLNDKDAVRMSMNLQTLYLALDCKGIPRYRHDSWEPRGVFHANISSNAHLGWDDPTILLFPVMLENMDQNARYRSSSILDPAGGMPPMAIYNARSLQRMSRSKYSAQPERHVPLLKFAAPDSAIHERLGLNSIFMPVVVTQIGRRSQRLSSWR